MPLLSSSSPWGGPGKERGPDVLGEGQDTPRGGDCTSAPLYSPSSSIPSIIQRDLKSKDIWLTQILEAKLLDFGVSRDCQEHSMTAAVGTPYWTSPEILDGKRYTEQVDM
ncbi:unnamed protein product [Phytophthora fragariaefolia]|uniref:Unnamed protein product n=1 Tax=Phytophthora fragariaefolia TaxID=1490495 RepID=A0A9W6UCV4_9STRA|nr:unnamed protein product [Phytophthora fragariaefolia]